MTLTSSDLSLRDLTDRLLTEFRAALAARRAAEKPVIVQLPAQPQPAGLLSRLSQAAFGTSDPSSPAALPAGAPALAALPAPIAGFAPPPGVPSSPAAPSAVEAVVVSGVIVLASAVGATPAPPATAAPVPVPLPSAPTEPTLPRPPLVREELHFPGGTRPVVVQRWHAMLGDLSFGEATLGTQPLELCWFPTVELARRARERLSRFVLHPAGATGFRWPLGLVHARRRPGLGVLTPQRNPALEPVTQRFADETLPLRARLHAALTLSQGFATLHAAGFAHGDLRLGDLWASRESHTLELHGLERARLTTLPPDELVPPEQPLELRATDLHALAVIVYGLLHGESPFAPSEGTQPPRFRHATEPSSSPTALWARLPRALRSLFSRALSTGRDDPAARPGAAAWVALVDRLRASVFPCPGCGLELFYDAAAVRERRGAPGSCPGCARAAPLPARLRLGAAVIVLPWGGKVFRHDADPSAPVGADVIAETSAHPYRANVAGLKNLSGQAWRVVMADGSGLMLPHGKTLRLETGQRIEFGPRTGEVRL